MGSIHELLKQVYPLKLRMELFNAIWTNWREDVKEKDQQIAELEHQLAEKDAELEKWSTQYAKAYVNRQNALIAEKVELQHQLAEKEKEQNQIAIEQLEKVKENIKKVPITDFDLSGNFEKMYKQDAIRQIDNQINGLKEKK